MKGKIARLFIVAVSVVLLAVPLIGAADSDVVERAAQIKEDDNISTRAARDWRGTDREWTPEEMRNAKPYPIPRREGRSPSVTSSEKLSVGEPGLIPGGPPEGGKQITLHMLEGDKVLSVAAPLDYPYPPPYTRYENFDKYKKYPYRTVGKLYFRQYGVAYQCSASSIGNYAIWTTGHCVHAGDGSYAGWSYDMVFVPALKNASMPYGQWRVANLWTKTIWYYNGDLAYDMGGAILKKREGKKISQVVGWLGFAWNWSYDQHWFDIGYPADFPFSGKKQIICTASHSYSDYSFDPPTVGMGCDMTGGCSGGPWIKDFSGKAGWSNYLNGHNGYYYVGYPEEIFSPYFDDRAYSLWYELVNDVP